MSLKRKRYEISSLPDSDDEDQDHDMNDDMNDDMDEFNEEAGDWGARAIEKEDDMEAKLETALMQKEDRDCWECNTCNIILNIKQSMENNDRECFRCGKEAFLQEKQRIVNYRGQWITPDRLKWRCLGIGGCGILNENIRSNQCEGAICKLFRNPPIGNFIKYTPEKEEIDTDKQFVLIDNELWPRLCRYCGWRSDDKQCIKCKSIKDMDPERIIKTDKIHLITLGYCRLKYEEVRQGGTWLNPIVGEFIPEWIKYLIHSFYIELEGKDKSEAIEALKNKEKKEEKPEKKKDKTMTKILSEEKVKGTTNEHVWPIKVTMKYRDAEDIIGKEGCFRIGVVSGERYFYLTGDGKFVDPSGNVIDAFYDGKIKNGDIIRVKLNMTFGRLEYEINGEDLGVAHKFGCHKKCRKNYKFYAYFKKKEIKCEKLGYELNKHTTWICEKCTTKGKIKQDICRYCNWSRIKGRAKGYDKIVAVHQKYEDKLNGTVES